MSLSHNIHLAQVQVHAGHPDRNLMNLIENIQTAPDGALIVAPEMVIPGYMIGDAWKRVSYLRECRDMNTRILEVLDKKGSAGVWGNVDFDEGKLNPGGASIRTYNAAYMAQGRSVLAKKYKTLLPTYRMFDDSRYFTSGEEYMKEKNISPSEYFAPVVMQIMGVNYRVAALICEEIWNRKGEYALDPVRFTKEHNPDIIAVTSASPFGISKAGFRKALLEVQSTGVTMAYVNPIGTQNIGKTIHAFDGGSALYDDGKFVKGIRDYTTDEIVTILEEKNEMEQIYSTLVFTLRQFWKDNGEKKFIIGLSGGLDSALVATLLVHAIGPENLIAINMPSTYNTNTTKTLAEQCARNLGIKYLVSPIQSIVDEEIEVIRATTGKDPTSFEIENIQARTRGIRLAGLAANLNALFTNNGNKDENATGYATLYGDVNGAIAPIGDLHKGLQVKPLARYINSISGSNPPIPTHTIEMQPTAELSSAQNPENGGGDPFDYPFLGSIIRLFQERNLSPFDILTLYKDKKLESRLTLERPLGDIFPTDELFIKEVEKIWRLYQINVFKRIQAPPIIQLSRSSFGFDYREAQNGIYFGSDYEQIKKQILG